MMVDLNLASTYDSTGCVNAADNVLFKYDIGTTYTYIMYICPAVVDFGNAVGVADIGGKKSWYKDTFGSSSYIQMVRSYLNHSFHYLLFLIR